MRKLAMVWFAWRLTRLIGAITLVAVLGALVLNGARTARPTRRAARTPIERAVQPIERTFQRTLREALRP